MKKIIFLALGLCGTYGAGAQTISGNAHTEGGNAIQYVDVTLTGPNVSASMQTGPDGNFSFSNLSDNQTYELCLSRPDAPANGVSSFDMVLMLKHILHLELLDSPYKIIAAETGAENQPPDVLDVYFTRLVVLNIATQFPAPSWRFIPADHVFPVPEEPFSMPFPEGCKTITLNGNATGQDFIGIKTADVNGSAISHD